MSRQYFPFFTAGNVVPDWHPVPVEHKLCPPTWTLVERPDLSELPVDFEDATPLEPDRIVRVYQFSRMRLATGYLQFAYIMTPEAEAVALAWYAQVGALVRLHELVAKVRVQA